MVTSGLHIRRRPTPRRCLAPYHDISNRGWVALVVCMSLWRPVRETVPAAGGPRVQVPRVPQPSLRIAARIPAIALVEAEPQDRSAINTGLPWLSSAASLDASQDVRAPPIGSGALRGGRVRLGPGWAATTGTASA